MKRIILRIVLLISIILTSLIIFEFSNQNANDSKEVSGKITEKIVNIFYDMNSNSRGVVGDKNDMNFVKYFILVNNISLCN